MEEYNKEKDNIDKALQILEHLMESDKRNFHNQETETIGYLTKFMRQ